MQRERSQIWFIRRNYIQCQSPAWEACGLLLCTICTWLCTAGSWSRITSQILFHLEFDLAAWPAICLILSPRSETWMASCSVTQHVLDLKTILEQKGEGVREVSRWFSSDGWWSRISIYFWNSMNPTQVQLHCSVAPLLSWQQTLGNCRRCKTQLNRSSPKH